MKRYILSDLLAWKAAKSRKPLIIYGARQIGKTYILRQFAKQEFCQYHYFNFEDQKQLAAIFDKDLNPQRIIEELSLFINHNIDIQNDLVIFDEIQDCPNAITSLKYFCEKMPSLYLVSTGSLLGLELNPTSYPVGKVDILQMFPMNFFEFLEASGDCRYLDYIYEHQYDTIPEPFHSELWTRLKHYFIIGGLPEIVANFVDSDISLFDKFQKARSLQHLLSKIYIADMAKHAGKQNSMHLERLWSNIPHQLSREIDGSAAKFKLKGQIPNLSGFHQIAGALDWLEKARLAIKVPIINSGNLPFGAYVKENTFKLFMFDIGLLGAIADLEPSSILSYDFGTYKGFFVENFVAQETFCANQGHKIYSWSENTAELEFLIQKDNKAIPVEVKSGFATQSKSAKVFQVKYNSPYRINISGKQLSLDYSNGVLNYPLYMAALVFKS